MEKENQSRVGTPENSDSGKLQGSKESNLVSSNGMM